MTKLYALSMNIKRLKDKKAISDLLALFPVVAILGPRQCGKTTLAQTFKAHAYFDFENPQDWETFSQPLLAVERLKGLVVIDEIQRMPELFPVLRHIVDTRKDLRFLILGSASRDLIQQSSESLAGRIAYHELSGFSMSDLGADQWQKLWMRGGFPLAYMAKSEKASQLWRQSYIQTFLERDIPQLGISIPSPTLRRFWMMLCHYHGQNMNYSEFARSFGVSDMTIRRYLDILEGTFMIRVLQPWHTNLGKRLVKSPKIYFRDTGLLHTLLSIQTEEELMSHPRLGASWEGFAIECVARQLGRRNEELSFWATHSGAEVDLYWQSGKGNYAVEVKYNQAPRLTPSMKSAVQELKLEHLWVVYPGNKTYPLAERVTAIPLKRAGVQEFQ